MKWQLLGDWPCGQFIIPSDTVIDSTDLKWAGSVSLPLPLPINAKALDQDALDELSKWYPHRLDQLQYASGLTIKKLINA